MEQQKQRASAEQEWTHKLLLFVSALLVFETLTGLSIYFLPFSLSNQVMVLLHTVGGLVFTIPFAIYNYRHFLLTKWQKFNHFQLTGYISTFLSAILIVSGIVLTWQALFQSKISALWDTMHVISTFGLIVSLLPHIGLVMLRNYKSRKNQVMQVIVAAQRKYFRNTSMTTIILFAVVFLLGYSYEPVKLNNEFPEDYVYAFGEDRPFAPSLAVSNTGGAFDGKSLADSKTCGTSGCHEQIYKEWLPSAHRYAAMDLGFQTIQNEMAKQNGPESTRYCGGCHDPVSLFSGTKNIFVENLTNLDGYQEGVSCISCHAIKEVDVKGNANYVMTQPERYMFEMREGKTAKQISDFLIRAYPKKHIETLQHRLFKSPEFCAACHKQFIDEEINQVGWVQLQNQYDNWRKSRWNHPGDATKTVECRECHMPLTKSIDPSSGDDLDYNRTKKDGMHRSHRFLAANQYMPLALGLPGAEEHVALTEKWLQGKIEIPEIAHKWKAGSTLPVTISVPERVKSGEKVEIQVEVTNNKVGHEFPTGPLDIIQAWIEVVVTDQNGNKIFASGTLDDKNFIKPGSFIFKAEPVDQYGNLIDKHNLWEMVGVRYRRTMFPGFSDKADFSFPCPSSPPMATEKPKVQIPDIQFKAPDAKVTELNVSAKLMYRKFDQYLMNFLFGADKGLTSATTVVSEDHKKILVN
jgi:hypothetical protein